jgi:ribonuclease P protein component
MRLERLRGRKVCDWLVKNGRIWKGTHMKIWWHEGHPRHPAAKRDRHAFYVGMIASTRLDRSAVKRNRMRRRCREAFRIALKNLSIAPTTQLLIGPRSSSLKAPFAALARDIEAFLRIRTHGRSETR